MLENHTFRLVVRIKDITTGTAMVRRLRIPEITGWHNAHGPTYFHEVASNLVYPFKAFLSQIEIGETVSKMICEEFGGSGEFDVPRLFSQTRDFRFHDDQGRLIHRKFRSGAKGLNVVAVESTGHEASFVEHDSIALTIPITGRAEVVVNNRKSIVKPGDIFLIGPSDRHSKLYPDSTDGRYRSYTIISSWAHHIKFDSDHRLHRPNCPLYTPLKHLLEYCFHGFLQTGRMASSQLVLVEALLEDALLDALQVPKVGTSKRDVVHVERIVRNATAYMQSHYSEPLSTIDIARAIGTGVRTLQTAFQTRLGTTPKQALNGLRIRALRSKLLCPEPFTTVTNSALECGIFHVGRCSLAYRNFYGELPSETLRRARQKGSSRSSD